MLKVWGRTNSFNVQKVMWTLAELDLPHQRIDAGGAFGELDTEAYGKLNPNRKIPVLEDGDTVVWESNAIVRYLAAKYGEGSLWASDPATRSLADRWMEWQVTTLQPVMHPIFWGLIRTPEEQRNRTEIETAITQIGPLFQILDAHLARHPFIAGASFSMGDIPLGCATWRYFNLPIDRPSLRNVEAWKDRLASRPGYAEHVMLPVT